MQGRKIDSVNHAIRESVPAIRRAATNPGVRVDVRASRFADGAQWHLPGAVDVNDFEWVDITDPDGLVELGEALRLLTPELDVPPLPQKTKPPVIVLVSGGNPTDDWRAGLAELLGKPWGRQSIRLAIGIGDDVDMAVLHELMGDNPEIKPLQANDAPTLVRFVEWAASQGIAVAAAAADEAICSRMLCEPPSPEPSD